MIRKAHNEDLPQIMEIISQTIEEMKTYNNTQWDRSYPQDRDFVQDINNGSLYVKEVDAQIMGLICVNTVQPEEYNDVGWSDDKKCMVIHRMAVNPSFRNQGVGSKLMHFAEQLAKENNVTYLKTDTYSINTKMNALFQKFKYKFVGEMNFLGKEYPFYCYDKCLVKE